MAIRSDETTVPISIRRLCHESVHWHPEPELIYVLEGTLTVCVQGRRSELSSGDLILVNGNLSHELYSPEGPVVLTLPLPVSWFDPPSDSGSALWFSCNSAEEPDAGRWGNLRSILDLMRNQASADTNTTASAYSLIRELAQFRVPAPDSDGNRRLHLSRMEEIARYVRDHYREGLRLNSTAKALHLSSPYLSTLFTQYLGISFSEYLNSVRLDHAVAELLSGNAPIESVAQLSGFSNAQSFGRAFKVRFGMIPSEFRRQGTLRKNADTAPNLTPGAQPPPAADHRPVPIQADWNRVVGTVCPNWNRVLGLGSAKEVLYHEIQTQLIEIQTALHFEYLRFHGLFSDEMMVVNRSSTGRLCFSFRTIDMVFDFLFSIGLKPMIELSFMPIELASDPQKTIFNNRFNCSAPARVDEWVLLVKTFFDHIISRYGLSLVETLPVTFWNNADSSPDMFGMGDEDAFFDTYRATYLAVKEVSPRIRFGAPSLTFMEAESIRWSDRFCRRLEAEHLRPDFLCVQYYGVDWNPANLKIDLHSSHPDHLLPAQKDDYAPVLAGIPLTTDPDGMSTYLRSVRRFFQQHHMGSIPLWFTEWNNSVSHHVLIRDTLFSGTYVLKNVLETAKPPEVLSYWSATDFIEEQLLGGTTFHGGLGIMTVDGIRKPPFLAFQALNELRPNILCRGNGYIVTRSAHTVSVLFYNYVHYNDIYAGNRAYNFAENNRYTPFSHGKPIRFSLLLSHLPDRDILEAVEYVADRGHGSVYDAWVEMGAPAGGVVPGLDRFRLQCLKAAAHPLIRTLRPDIQNGTLRLELTLNPLEFRLIQIKLR